MEESAFQWSQEHSIGIKNILLESRTFHRNQEHTNGIKNIPWKQAFYKTKRKEDSMKKKVLAVMIAAMAALSGCGGEGEESTSPIVDLTPVELATEEPATEPEESVPEETPEAEVVPEEVREGMYRSELTNEWIDESLRNQRPVAVMVDNEKIALPHYGLTEADIVYEMMNSTENSRITRFMAIVKDWGKIEQFGSIRSTRSTNVYLSGEWNAVLCHDGGPYFAMNMLVGEKKEPYSENISGWDYFTEVNNGKKKEFREYIVAGDLEDAFNKKGYSVEYNEYYEGPHYTFSKKEVDLDEQGSAFACNEIQLIPFKHNQSTLKYNEETGTYDYYEYGQAHLDPQHDNAPLTFKNLLIQKCSFSELGEGYLVYNILDGAGNDGYYIVNGKAIEVTWYNMSATSPTTYYSKATGEKIELDTGKTYIAIVPDDTWDQIVIK